MKIEEKARMIEKIEDAVAVIRDFEKIIRSRKKNIVWLAFQQGVVFSKFKKKEKFIKIITKCCVSRSTISLKIVISFY